MTNSHWYNSLCDYRKWNNIIDIEDNKVYKTK